MNNEKEKYPMDNIERDHTLPKEQCHYNYEVFYLDENMCHDGDVCYDNGIHPYGDWVSGLLESIAKKRTLAILNEKHQYDVLCEINIWNIEHEEWEEEIAISLSSELEMNIKNLSTCETLCNFINEHGEFDGSAKTYTFPSSHDRLNFSFIYGDTKKRFDILYMGIYHTIATNKRVVNFLGIEVDENGEDTTNEVFFDWDELSCEVQYNIMKVVHGEYLTLKPSSDYTIFYYHVTNNKTNETTESDEPYYTERSAYGKMKEEVMDYDNDEFGERQIICNKDKSIRYINPNRDLDLTFRVVEKPKYQLLTATMLVRRDSVNIIKNDIESRYGDVVKGECSEGISEVKIEVKD